MKLWLFTYFPTLRTTSFRLDLTNSYYSLAVAPCTSMKSTKEVVTYFLSLTFETTPIVCLFHEENELGALRIWAKRFYDDTLYLSTLSCRGILLSVGIYLFISGQDFFRALCSLALVLSI